MEFVSNTTEKEYEDFVSSHIKGHFMQSRTWGKVKDNWKWEGVIVRDTDGSIKGALSVLIRKVPFFNTTIMYAPRGPVCDIYDKETFNGLISGARELAKKYKSYVLKMDPDIKADDCEFRKIAIAQGFEINAGSKNFEGIQPNYVFRLYLQGRGKDQIMASFQSKTRYNIRVAQKNNVYVKIEGKQALKPFHDIMMETGIRDGFVIRSRGYFEKMLDCLGDNARLYMAYIDEKPIAGTLAVNYGDKVWYLYGASSNSYRNFMPNYLLQWEMICWAIEKGCRIYDFRGVSGDIDESNPLYGLYRFKKGFNGEFTEFIGEMDLVFNKPMNVAVHYAERMFRVARKYVFLMKNRNKASKDPLASND